MIYPELDKLIREVNALSVCSVDDICDGLLSEVGGDFVHKSDVLDILNRYVHDVYERKKLNLQIDLTQANLDVILAEQQNRFIAQDRRMIF